MIFTPTDLAGAFIVEAEPHSDDRGAYTRTWCAREFAAHGLNVSLAQSGLSYNRRRGTIRGMHMQTAPHAQTRLVRCGRGAIYDVIIDLRPDSPTYCRWLAAELRFIILTFISHDPYARRPRGRPTPPSPGPVPRRATND